MEKLGVLDNLRITVLAEDSVLYESPYLGQHGVSLLLEGVSAKMQRESSLMSVKILRLCSIICELWVFPHRLLMQLC